MEAADEMIGQVGPGYLNTRIQSHGSIFTNLNDDECDKMDTIKIGERGVEIRLKDILRAFKKADNMPRVEGRSYYLEGVTYSNNTLYIEWGS
jgi:hypothetical protein